MVQQLRQGIVDRQPEIVFYDEEECDKVDVAGGHKGHPEAVKKRRIGRRQRLKGDRGRGALENEKPPILGML